MRIVIEVVSNEANVAFEGTAAEFKKLEMYTIQYNIDHLVQEFVLLSKVAPPLPDIQPITTPLAPAPKVDDDEPF